MHNISDFLAKHQLFIDVVLSGSIAFTAIIGICNADIIMQALTRVLAGVEVVINVKNFLEARESSDIEGMATAAL